MPRIEELSGPMAHRPTKSVPRGLVGMLVMVAAIESLIAGLRPDLASPLAEDWRIAARAATEKAPGSDVLCFGDSLVKYGVLPRVIEARTGLKTYNLSTSGGTMPSSLFLLRQALEAGARPKAIIADFAALMLPDPDPPARVNYAELASFGDCVDLAWASKSGEFLGQSILSKLLPSYQWRFELRVGIRASLDGRSVSQRAFLPLHRAGWASELGAQPMPSGRVRHPSENFLIDGVSPIAWKCEPRNVAYLDRFLTLAGSRGIPVYWLMPPLCPEAHVRRATRGSDAAYDRFARSMVARHPNVVVVDVRFSGYDDSVHIDHIHLDRRGASVLSDDLAAILLERLGTNRPGDSWVAMPVYGGRMIDDSPAALASLRELRARERLR